MDKIASMFFHSRTQAHVFHLRLKKVPGSYATHKALDEYYTDIVDLIDGLVESYQGKYGLIEFKNVNGIDNDSSIENIIAYFEKLCKFVDSERKNENLQDSYIQNQIDTVCELLYSTLYKLKNLE